MAGTASRADDETESCAVVDVVVDAVGVFVVAVAVAVVAVAVAAVAVAAVAVAVAVAVEVDVDVDVDVVAVTDADAADVVERAEVVVAVFAVSVVEAFVDDEE